MLPAYFQPPFPAAVVTSGGVVNYDESVVDGGDGYTYLTSDGRVERIPSDGGRSAYLFQFSNDTPFALIVRGSECYATFADGTLWRAEVGPEPGAPERIEQRGAYDDDDFDGVIGMDANAVYWLAGVDPSLRTSDRDPIALYRTCRP